MSNIVTTAATLFDLMFVEVTGDDAIMVSNRWIHDEVSIHFYNPSNSRLCYDLMEGIFGDDFVLEVNDADNKHRCEISESDIEFCKETSIVVKMPVPYPETGNKFNMALLYSKSAATEKEEDVEFMDALCRYIHRYRSTKNMNVMPVCNLFDPYTGKFTVAITCDVGKIIVEVLP